MTEVLRNILNHLNRKIDTQIPKAENLERICIGDAQIEAKALKIGLIEDKKLVGKILQETKDVADSIETDDEYSVQRIAKLEGEIFRLDEIIKSHESKISTLQEEAQATKTELREMRDNMNGMREEMSEMGNKMRAMSDTLSTGQIAFVFEQDLALYVYPNGKKIGSNKIFTRLKEWLKDKEETPQGKEANKKWKALQEKVSWSTMHEDVLKKLRDSRIEYAHPRLDLETAKSQIPDDLFNVEEKKCIEDIIHITKEVNDRMEEEE